LITQAQYDHVKAVASLWQSKQAKPGQAQQKTATIEAMIDAEFEKEEYPHPHALRYQGPLALRPNERR
jgi:hypothetical protein